MSKKDEALKLALEALGSCSAGDYSTGHVIHPSFDADAVNKAIEAIDALSEQTYPDNFIHALMYDVAKRDSEALAEQCVCGEPDTPGTHRTDGPCLAEQPAQQQEVDWEKLYRLEVKKKEALAAKYERDTGKKLTRIVPMAEQPAQQQEPVANGLPLVIAGAIFDFAGYLTTRDIVIEVGSTANASPVADLVRDWAALRGLSLADAAVLSWQEWLTDVHAIDTLQERVDEMQKHRHDTSPPASKPWVGLTDEERGALWYRFDYMELMRAIEAKLKEKNT